MSQRSIALSLVLFVVSGSHALAADDVAARLRTCRAIAEVPARAACYDKVVDDQAAPPRTAATPAPVPAASPPPAQVRAAPPAAPAETTARFGAENLPAERRPEPAPAQADVLTAKVVAFTPGATGKATITLDNGQVWAQVENERLYLRPGAGVTLKRGVLGSYMLIPEGMNGSYRVTRRR